MLMRNYDVHTITGISLGTFSAKDSVAAVEQASAAKYVQLVSENADCATLIQQLQVYDSCSAIMVCELKLK